MAERKYQPHSATRSSNSGSSNRQASYPTRNSQGYSDIPWTQDQQNAYGAHSSSPFMMPNMTYYTSSPIPQQDTGSSTGSSSGNESTSASVVDIATLPPHSETERWLRRTTGIPADLPLNLTSYEIAKNGPLGRSRHDLRARLAIWGHPDKRATLDEIDQALKQHFEATDYSPKWKDSIRHMLTLKKHFVLEPLESAESSIIPRLSAKANKGGKQGGYWRLDLRGESQLTRARKRRTPGSKQDEDSGESIYDQDEEMLPADILHNESYFPSNMQNVNAAFHDFPSSLIPNTHRAISMQEYVDMANLHPSSYINNRPVDFLQQSNLFDPSGMTYTSSPTSSNAYSPASSTYSPALSDMTLASTLPNPYNQRSNSAPAIPSHHSAFQPGHRHAASYMSGNAHYLVNPSSNQPISSNQSQGQFSSLGGGRSETLRRHGTY
ncbi:hypothetical protein CVT24_002934 [Panaeolus cyanescens]|uniref:Fork-head domain-containing protein n=1 Tax=Panaeolus cyanescens TaxID=181874 RepID=A0A409VP13_9AGAR|nr:hypothetical protein CVT24_002934 [Panaeolus cyanescens]